MRITLLIILITNLLFAKELISPIEENVIVDINKALLGKKLFFEKRLSKDNTISCASCHIIAEGGDDNKRVSEGINKKKGSLNAPTVLNSKYNFVQFWDGRAKNLEEQAAGPIHNPIEMGSDLKTVVKELKKDPGYVKRFREVFNDVIKPNYITEAIAEFENALVTPNSRFDKFLKGDIHAITEYEKEGFELFKSYGCISCHNGVNMGGNLFQKMGILKKKDYQNKEYLGRYNVTKDEEDKFFYKVPGLRNIEQTAPYFHSGEVKTLKEAVELMMEFQLGIKPNSKSVEKIEAFLKTLNGEMPKIMELK